MLIIVLLSAGFFLRNPPHQSFSTYYYYNTFPHTEMCATVLPGVTFLFLVLLPYTIKQSSQ